ncbi:hypothetical protein [Wolinella succinogenes]|uniref:Uncharacterized protein n=1 Tax=Wolinella succinogenes (strain ATCC 29543 / DSM 1740 / CCUG 13145 / JCM 31913 / LMG 7466 / NCTC 11488 / FDC 602W) TaxID=273121 RepID=Q7MR80_WOLSU|nr:hypothetical protein [Wolinella succinogenes]CAE10632.1 hypothetical protein WS1593 [Wolinella succinogenes]VEG80777.1 Uncharacterised protein [Wolinella succinogenes]HCZ18693.1 hypothetical protein [Helicobacter sp.]
MKLSEIQSAQIITHLLGTRGALKSEEELALCLKRHLTKKELKALNLLVSGAIMEEILTAMNLDEARYKALVESASKKIKNQNLHKEFYVL